VSSQPVPGPVRIFTRLVERYAVLADDLILDAVRHCPATDIFEVLGNLLLAMEFAWRARSGVAIDDVHLGIVSVKTCEQVSIELLDSAAHRLEIEHTGGILFVHRLSPLP
jgi:hypothetical protein